jgi:NodT family efflux transporter outer membrane factor (OMF) lipoprotein
MNDLVPPKGLSPTVLAVGVIASTISGCAVGPQYKTPRTLEPAGYTSELLPTTTEAANVVDGGSQRFEFGHDVSGQWWELFGSPRLNALIEEAFANYPDVTAQQAALKASRENVRVEEGMFLPQIQGVGNYEREQVSGASIGPGYPGFITSVYQATVNVSYTFDIFGGQRRTLEGLIALAEAQRFVLEASYLTLSSNVASTAIQLASVTDQIAATKDVIESETKELELIKRRFDVGSQSRSDVLQQESALNIIRATLPGLEQQQAVAEHQIAVLTGHSPHDVAPARFTLADLKLPMDLPVSLPAALVEQRPDIRQQEAVVHKASSAVGVATANMLPQLTLTGAFGGESLVYNTLFQPGSGIWNVAAGVTQPLFQGGTLRAKRRAAIDSYDQAVAQYRLTVLKSFQNVADTLTALEHDAQSLQAQSDSMDTAKASLNLVQMQYDVGTVSYVSLLTAQQAYAQARLTYVQAFAARYTDTVTLFQALGGAWWNRADKGALKLTSR